MLLYNCLSLRRAKTMSLVFAAVLGVPLAPAAGDYFVATVGGFQRLSDAGALVYTYPGLGETVDGLAFGPDQILYVSTNDLGIGTIYRFDPATNAFIDAPGLNNGFNNFTFGQPGSMEFNGAGHLFAIGTDYTPEGTFTTQYVMRIDSSGNLVDFLDGAIPVDPPGSSSFVDLAIRSNGDVYVAKGDGSIQRHAVDASDTTLVDTLLTGVSGLGWMAFGPDGLLYLREGVNNSIVRYDVDAETVVDTFVASVPFTDGPFPGAYGFYIGDIFFGPTGNLLAVNNNDLLESTSVSHLVELDGNNGAFLQIVASHGPGGFVDGFSSRGLYVSIPEPSALTLSAVMTVGMMLGRHRRHVSDAA